MKLSKPLGILTGLAVAFGSISPFCCSFSDIPVHADFADLAGAVDYFESLEGADAVAFGTSGGAVVAGVLLGVWMCTQNPIQLGSSYDMSSLTTYTCLYRWNGEEKLAFVNIYSVDNFTSSDGGYDIITSADFDIRVETSPSATISSSWDNGQLNVGVLNYQGQGVQRWWDTKLHFDQVLSSNSASSWGYWGRFGLADIVTPPEYANYSGAFPVKFGNAYPLYPVVLDLCATSTGLGGLMDPADPMGYINNVVRPWVITNYPDFEDLLPDGDVDLPTSPTIDFTIPTADLSPLDPSEVIDNYSSPVSFWWTLTSDILDLSGLKWLALFGLSCAIFAYIIWRLGR